MSQTPDTPREDELDPDADPANLPSPAYTADTPPVDGAAAAVPVQDDPDDEVDPDADPQNLTSGR